MGIVLMIHSIVRWAIVVVAVVAMIKLGLGWLQGKKFEKMDRGLLSGFSGLMDLQMLLGLIYFIGDGMTNGFPMYRIEHATTLILAVVVSHLPARRWKDAEDKIRLRNSFFAVVVAMLLIISGVATVGGWGS